MDPTAQASAVRQGVGLFRPPDRGLIQVTGADAQGWLDRMLTNEVATLSAEGPRSGCYALLLTVQGRIVADLHVLARAGCWWLETAGSFVPTVLERMGKLIVADDVVLEDRSAAVGRLGLEGPGALAVLEAASDGRLDLLPDACGEVVIAGADVVVSAFGWTGCPAYQLLAPVEATPEVSAALLAAGGSHGLVEAGSEAFEILRVEAGVPRLGAELDEEVLPPEANLDHAVSTTKGCYTGQEVVARLRSQGKVAHRMVGLRFDEAAPPPPDSAILAEERRIGEITSAVVSPVYGAIALGFVRRSHAEPGTRLVVEAGAERPVATVASLPFVQGAGRPTT